MGRTVDPEEEAPLVPIDEYRDRILGSVDVLAPRSVPLVDAWGCVLASDVFAPSDLPPFESSAMDGYAVRSDDIASASEAAPVALEITSEVRIGRPATTHVSSGAAVAISTGAVVPSGADAVVPVELTDRDGDRVLVMRALPARKHVRPAGEDVRAGDLLLSAGRRLHAPDLGALAAAGFADVDVIPRARVGIVSTGDELVRPGHVAHEAQIYDSNTFTLTAAVREFDAVAVDGGPVSDEPEALIAALDRLAGRVDVFVCSGGVSMGAHDPVKRAFSGGGQISFANVGMQPGRPQAFGSWGDKPFFGLPGNPISVFVSFEVFVRPALAKMCGRTDQRMTVDAVLDGRLEAPRTRTRFARVTLRREAAGFVASPEGGHQSNLLVTFARADGLVEIPAGTRIEDGDRCRVRLIREV
jgi:molybdopterin molybdotransferase